MKLLAGVIAAAIAVAGTLIAADETDPESPHRLIAPARILAAPPPPADDDEATADEPEMTDEESTGGVPLQYRTRRGGPQPEPAASRTRFILPLNGELVLVDAHITVDGAPFRMRREHRVDAILASLLEPTADLPASGGSEAPSDEPAPESTTDAETSEPTEAADTDPAEDISPAETPAETPETEEAATEPPPPDNSITGWLQRYVKATQRTPSREEVQWLLRNWSDGPVLLVLNDNFQRLRARQTPVFRILDRDEDGTVSESELVQAVATLRRYDRNQDDLLAYEEIAAGATRTPVENTTTALPPMIPLADLLRVRNRDSLVALDQDGNGDLDATDIAALSQATPDVQINVTFDTADPSSSNIEVVALAEQYSEASATVRADSVTLAIGGTLVEWSAVQGEADATSDQVSIGAVRDGYPILPALDLNDDGRLTLRELRHTGQQLATFDRNRDGQISLDEIPKTVRVAFGLGATVHEHLLTVRSVHPPPTGPEVTPPAWFVRSDVNKDGDLTPKEFLGNREQFALVDTDSDGLISDIEAARSAEKKSSSEPSDNADNEPPEESENQPES